MASDEQKIKLQLLQLAKETLLENYYSRSEEKRQYNEAQVRNAERLNAPVTSYLTLPDTPTVDQIIEQAEKYLKFVK